MAEFDFGLPGIAPNGGNQFWSDRNGLECRKSVLA
jgi:hypothetical protein